MSNMIPLNAEQQHMVENNLSLVKKVIHKHIHVLDAIPGLDFDDLFQEGCIWLCKAAVTFQKEKDVKFETYAERVVSNGLRSYCRLTYNKQKRICSLSDYAEYGLDRLPSPDSLDDDLIQRDIFDILHKLKANYSGVARLGVEAIEWKVKGLSGVEIANMYGVKPNAVGAWISRAVQKLKKNIVFTLWMEQLKEHNN